MPETQQDLFKEEQRMWGRIFGVIGIIMGFCFVAGNVWNATHPDGGFSYSHYSEVTGILSTWPEKYSASRSNYIFFVIKEYPNTEFRVEGIALNAISQKIVGTVDSADMATITIDNDDARALLTGKQPKRVMVYGLASNGKTFIDIKDYRQAVIDENTSYFMGVLGCIMIAGWSLSFYKNRKKHHSS